MTAMALNACRECGAAVNKRRATREFCGAECRRRFNNRRVLRGALLYDVLMHLRFERGSAAQDGAWSLLCRMASRFRTEDRLGRAGRRSWHDIADLRARHAQFAATLVGKNVGGGRRVRAGAAP